MDLNVDVTSPGNSSEDDMVGIFLTVEQRSARLI